ncbi:MAG: methionyl-tRNA formyltransferase [Solirubrobacterales bacterium]
MSRTVFLGTSAFAADVLRRLADSPHRPALVLTPPDRPRGRGRRLASPPAADEARTLGIELSQAADVNDAGPLDRIRAADPDVVALCAFGQLVAEPLLSECFLINVHPSLLPRWRGAAPIERAIMAGDAETGVSVMRVTEGLDLGPVALQERTSIGPGEDFGSLSARLAEHGGELLVRALDLHEAGTLELQDQDDAEATYAEKIAPRERRLDPARSADELAATVRALTPHVGVYLELEGGGRLGISEARPARGELPPGALETSNGELRLGCGSGVLALLVVQPAGGRPMAAEDYLRGHAVPAAAR